ncbi:hypothetical protein ACHAWF_003873 [Thalassiosira exigua]
MTQDVIPNGHSPMTVNKNYNTSKSLTPTREAALHIPKELKGQKRHVCTQFALYSPCYHQACKTKLLISPLFGDVLGEPSSVAPGAPASMAPGTVARARGRRGVAALLAGVAALLAGVAALLAAAGRGGRGLGPSAAPAAVPGPAAPATVAAPAPAAPGPITA